MNKKNKKQKASPRKNIKKKVIKKSLKKNIKTKLNTKDANSKLLSLPRINLTNRQTCDLELIINGGFAPLKGFLEEADYNSVLERMKLKDGTIWPIPIVFDAKEPLVVGNEVILCDQYGNPLAILKVGSVFTPDKEKEALLVYGTNDRHHVGVRYLFENTHNIYVGGQVTPLALPKRYDFSELRKTPKELKDLFKKNKWKKVIAFQTRNPLHRAHYEIIKRAADLSGAKILLHPAVGETKEGDIDYVTRVRCYKKLHEKYMKDSTVLSLLPIAMRMAGPREAIWHAIIRKNYGATHFIIGRDHAGPGKDKSGKPFYGDYDAQNLALKHQKDIGLTIVPAKEMVYIENEDKYVSIDEVTKTQTVKNISGTEFRKLLETGGHIPEWFSFPEVIEILRKKTLYDKTKGITIFFTGLPSSGKSTIANLLLTALEEVQDRKVSLLDGDVVRLNLSKGLSFSKEDRITNIERIGFVANEITKHKGIVICSAIAPFEEARARNRSLISKNGEYIEVYVSTKVEVCKSRDPKGLYKKAEAGLITGFTGVNDPYEVPLSPEITIDAGKESPTECVQKILTYLRSSDLL